MKQCPGYEVLGVAEDVLAIGEGCKRQSLFWKRSRVVTMLCRWMAHPGIESQGASVSRRRLHGTASGFHCGGRILAH
jgi:hypothetical protein